MLYPKTNIILYVNCTFLNNKITKLKYLHQKGKARDDFTKPQEPLRKGAKPTLTVKTELPACGAEALGEAGPSSGDDS